MDKFKYIKHYGMISNDDHCLSIITKLYVSDINNNNRENFINEIMLIIFLQLLHL